MSTIPHPNKSRTTDPLCCTVEQAVAWLNCLTEMALIYHDDDAVRALPLAAQHYLDSVRQSGETAS